MIKLTYYFNVYSILQTSLMNKNPFYLTHDVQYLHRLIFFYTPISYTLTYTLQLLHIHLHTQNHLHKLTFFHTPNILFHTTYELEIAQNPL